MKHLIILVPQGQNNLSSIVGSYKILSRADAFWQRSGKPSVFNIQLAGLSKEVEMHNGLFAVRPHTSINKISKTDLVIIPSLNYDVESILQLNQEFHPWIIEQHRKGAAVASICIGAFLLADTGLLNGKKCSTHWHFADLFKKKFPEVNLVADKIITDENGFYTSGGAYSFLNLILYIVEKYYDRNTAIYCSKIFEIDIERSSQSIFTIFSGQKEHDDEVVKEAQVFIEQNVDDKLSMEKLATKFAVGRRNFDRRFKRATGNTPAEYWQRVRIEAAKKKFENTRKNITEVMYEAGYSDTKAFRSIFKKFTGLSPLEYRNKYNKETVVSN